MVVAAVGCWGQEVERPFPYPAIPDLIREPQARLEYLLERYWSLFDFNDTTAVNRLTEEQGFVDYINILQMADSAVAAKSVRILMDSVSHDEARMKRYESLIDHYLGNPNSPMRNDATYAHLLRVMPQTPQRKFLLGEVTKNLPGTIAADFTFVDDEGLKLRMHEVRSPLTMLVFFDPHCDHCEKMMPQIIDQTGRVDPTTLKVLYVNTELNEMDRLYYLPAMPSLYLLDAEKRVIIKDGSLDQIMKVLLPNG